MNFECEKCEKELDDFKIFRRDDVILCETCYTDKLKGKSLKESIIDYINLIVLKLWVFIPK